MVLGTWELCREISPLLVLEVPLYVQMSLLLILSPLVEASLYVLYREMSPLLILSPLVEVPLYVLYREMTPLLILSLLVEVLLYREMSPFTDIVH